MRAAANTAALAFRPQSHGRPRGGSLGSALDSAPTRGYRMFWSILKGPGLPRRALVKFADFLQSIRARLFLLALAIMLPVAGLLAWFLVADAERAREDAHARVGILAANTAAAIERRLREAEATLGRLAARPLVKAMDPGNCDPIVANYVTLHPEFTTLGLRDLQGNIVCSYIQNPIRQLNTRDFPWFEEGLRSGRFTAGNAFRGRQVGRWVAVLTHPVRDEAGTLVGLLTLPVDLLKLGEQVLGSVPANTTVSVTDRQRVILLRSADAAAFVGTAAPPQAYAATRDLREGFISTKGPDGVQRLYTFLTIPGIEWRVVAGIAETAAYADYHETRRRTLGIGLGVLMLALWLAWRVGGATVRPIAGLAAVAERIATGDSATRARVTGPSEIRAVAEMFNRMLDARDGSEAALRASEENLAITLQSIGDAVIATDANGRITRMNPVAERLTGWSQAGASGRPFGEVFRIVDSHTRLPAQDPVRRVLERGEVVSLSNHTALLARNDIEYQIADSAAPIRDRTGAVAGVVLVFADVTEQYRARQALRDSERRLRTIIDTEPECVKVVDRAGNLIEMNAAGLIMLEADSLQAVQRLALLDYIVPEARPAFIALHQRVMNGETGTLEFEVIGLKGTRRWLETHAAPMRDADGRIDTLLGITRDITARKRSETERVSLESQLRESQKMQAIGTLAGGIAHDFNNIIGTILGNVELAHDDAGANPGLQQSLAEIRKAGIRARDLVQQILSFSRRQPTALRLIEPGAVAGEVVRLLRSTLPARVEVEARVASDTGNILADITQIEQVLLNLCVNAEQAMAGRAGRIDIDVRTAVLDGVALRTVSDQLAPGPFVVFSVSDTGHGMDHATRERIFEPFFTTKPVGQGTGLGLAVADGIVRAHQGAIAVASEPGKGSRFDVYLPVAEGIVTVPAALALAPLAATGQGRHVLYIDDDESLVLLVSRLLQRRGYRVSGHVDPAAALAELKTDPARFDLVVTDYNMPRISGLDVARDVRDIRPDLPVVIASGFITDELQSQATAAGVRQVIFKANAAEEFCNVVQRLLQAPAN